MDNTSAIAWTSSSADILSLLDGDDADAFLARKARIRVHGEDVSSIVITMEVEWFKTIYAVASPVHNNQAWRVVYTAISEGTEMDLAGLVSLSVSNKVFEVSPSSIGPRITAATAAGSNVLRRIINELEKRQRDETFENFLVSFPTATIISASLQPHWRVVSGEIEGRRFVVEMGKQNPKSSAKVTLHSKESMLRPARYGEIFHFPLNQELVELTHEELTIRLLQAGLDAEQRRLLGEAR